MRVWLAGFAAIFTSLIFVFSRTPETARLAVGTLALLVHAIVTRRNQDKRLARSVIADTTVVGLAMAIIAIPAVTIAGLSFALAVSTLLLSHRHAPVVWTYALGWATLSVWQTNTPQSLPDAVQPPATAAALLFFLGGLTSVVAVVTRALRRSAREQVEAREIIEQRQEQLRASNEKLATLLASKDRFVASISHELRTPLTAVVGLARELAEREFPPEERLEFQNIIAAQATEVSYIVEDLLVAARRDVGISVHLEPCPVPEIIRAVTSAIHVPVALTIPDHLEAYADPLRLRQVIRNLLTNAQRYGGEHIELEATAGNGSVQIEIRDDGEGIRENDATRIFEAYETASAAAAEPASIGLGLSVARTLAHLMHGDVRHRRDGEWTVFSLEVPVASRG